MIICEPYTTIYGSPDKGSVADEGWYGQCAEPLEREGGLVKVRMDYGYEGYVSESALMDEEMKNPMRVCAPFADVMDVSSYKGRRLLTLPRGALLDVRTKSGEWRRVRLLGGGDGYVRETHIMEFRRHTPPYPESLRHDIVETALSYLGTPYRWGGRTPMGVDCSGLCHAVYLINGLTIYRDSAFTEGYGVRRIPIEEIKEGDLIYFDGHVAIYIGGGRYVHSTGKAGVDRVRINSLDKHSADYRPDLMRTLLHAGSVF